MAKDNKTKQDQSLEEPSTVVNPTQSLDSGNNTSAPEPNGTNGGNVKPPRKRSVLGRLSFFANMYFIIFLVLLLLTGAGVYLTVRSNNKNNSSQGSKAQSLTDKQLADLKGNTTLVGTSQQTLDIQGSAIFENPVLMRNSLDVVGSIKVGGSLSLPAITVGGSSSFGQIQVTQTLLVGGNATLQGSLTVQKGLTVNGASSFGALSASQLNVSTLQLNGDLVISRHLNVSGGTPSASGGPALGGGGTVSDNGSDTSGTITINTGGSPPAGCFVTINFKQRFNSTPHVVISPSNSSAGAIDYYANRSTGNLSICDASPPAASTTYVFDYIVVD